MESKQVVSRYLRGQGCITMSGATFAKLTGAKIVPRKCFLALVSSVHFDGVLV